MAQLKQLDIPHYVQTESDGEHAGQLMAIGLEPCDRSKVRGMLKRYRLIR